MANIRFYGTEKSETEDIILETFVNINNELFISIGGRFICLDIDTSVQLAKKIRVGINEMKKND